MAELVIGCSDYLVDRSKNKNQKKKTGESIHNSIKAERSSQLASTLDRASGTPTEGTLDRASGPPTEGE